MSGNNLVVPLNVNIIDTIIGENYTIKNIDGEEIIVPVPKESLHGSVVEIKGKGMPIINTPHRNSLLVEIHTKIPSDLDESIIEKLKELKEIIKNTNK